MRQKTAKSARRVMRKEAGGPGRLVFGACLLAGMFVASCLVWVWLIGRVLG